MPIELFLCGNLPNCSIEWPPDSAGAAGMGIIAEKPEKFGQVLFFFVIPETLWIIGFVLGIILLLDIL